MDCTKISCIRSRNGIKKKSCEERKHRIIKNFNIFREAVFVAAHRYLPAFELICGVNHPKRVEKYQLYDNLRRASGIQARHLLSPSLFKEPHEFIIDKDVLYKEDDSDILDLFDNNHIPEVIPLIDEDEDENQLVNGTLLDDDMSSSQVLSNHNIPHRLLVPSQEVWYALYQLHCGSCTSFNSYCPVPLCGHVRSIATQIEQVMRDQKYTLEGHSEALEDYSVLFGTGHHPLEKAIKSMVQHHHHEKKLFRAYSGKEFAITVNLKCQTKERNDLSTVEEEQARRLDASKALGYNNYMMQACQLRYLDRRIIPSSLVMALNPEDVLQAKGGEWMSDENQLPYDQVSSMLPYIPPSIQADPLGSKDSEDEKEIDPVTLPSAHIEIPWRVIKALLGNDKHADYGHGVALQEADPYPDKKTTMQRVSSDMQPMSMAMFHWLTTRLHVYRFSPSHPIGVAKMNSDVKEAMISSVPNSVADTVSALRSQGIGIKFDRMHCEGLVLTVDGTLVTMQIVHGISPTDPSDKSSRRSCPQIASRFLMGAELLKLQYGVTIHVHDRLSATSRALVLRGTDLSRLAEYFSISDCTDLAKLSRHILAGASTLIKITRVGNNFTGIELTYSRNKPTIAPTDDNNHQKHEPISYIAGRVSRQLVQMIPRGRREVIIDRSKELLAAAERLSQK